MVLDEVQRVPELLDVVHDLLEGPDRRQFILTGSSARKLRRGGVDLLAGRAVVKSCHPFMAAELPDFDLGQALMLGMVPLVLGAPDPPENLRAYTSLYLEEEVRLEGWVRQVGDFARFLEGVSFSHGQPLNISNVARECQVRRKTVEGFLDVLEDLLPGFRLKVFSRRAGRATTSHPKFFLFDAGVFRSLRPQGPLDRPEEVEGGALEVKNTRKARPEDLRALRSFQEDFPEAEAILLYRGDERLRTGEILYLPVSAFLQDLHPGKDIH